MPTPRTPLGPINTNRVQKKPKKELTPLKRAEILGASKCGIPNYLIADALNEDKSLIRKTLNKALIRNNQRSLPRSSRPKKYTDRDYRKLVNYIRKNPWDSWQ